MTPIPRKPAWYNFRFRVPVNLVWPMGESQVERLIGLQVGQWFIGGIKGNYKIGEKP